MKKYSRSPFEFQQEAERVLKPLHNLFAMFNTLTFVVWWLVFGVVVFFSHWIQAPFNLVVMATTFTLTMVKTHRYFPAMSEYQQNVRHMRRLADEARQNFSRDDIELGRMSWKEILFGIGRPSRRAPRHLRDHGADWCFNHRELLMTYLDALLREVKDRQRQRRAEQRYQQRQLTSMTDRHIEIPTVMSIVMGAARSVVLKPERRVKIVRPTEPKPHREHRPRARSCISTTNDLRPVSAPRLHRLDEVVELLDLADLVPPGIDHEHVRAIIIWGCLNPGQRGRTMVLAQYITEQNARKSVSNKLGPLYNPAKFEAALAWLRRTRVVISDHKRKRHQPVLALNPHYREGIDVGRVAIQRVLAAKDAIVQLTAS